MMIILYLHESLCGLSRSLEWLILGLIHFLFSEMSINFIILINAIMIKLFKDQTDDLDEG